MEEDPVDETPKVKPYSLFLLFLTPFEQPIPESPVSKKPASTKGPRVIRVANEAPNAG
jgi:hypothetical protein